jgi:hypothetical protein
LTFPEHAGLWVEGELFAYSKDIVQLDVRLGGFDGDRVLIESIAGFGDTLHVQSDDALGAFANASFHVLLAAFFGCEPCHGTERESWTIGTERLVYRGLITTVFGYPRPLPNGSPDLDFYPAFLSCVKSQPLPPGTHWIRLYQARSSSEVFSNEVLLDNESWSELESAMAAYPWPAVSKAYDVRTFLVLRDLPG